MEHKGLKWVNKLYLLSWFPPCTHHLFKLIKTIYQYKSLLLFQLSHYLYFTMKFLLLLQSLVSPPVLPSGSSRITASCPEPPLYSESWLHSAGEPLLLSHSKVHSRDVPPVTVFIPKRTHSSDMTRGSYYVPIPEPVLAIIHAFFHSFFCSFCISCVRWVLSLCDRGGVLPSDGTPGHEHVPAERRTKHQLHSICPT